MNKFDDKWVPVCFKGMSFLFVSAFLYGVALPAMISMNNSAVVTIGVLIFMVSLPAGYKYFFSVYDEVKNLINGDDK